MSHKIVFFEERFKMFKVWQIEKSLENRSGKILRYMEKNICLM